VVVADRGRALIHTDEIPCLSQTYYPFHPKDVLGKNISITGRAQVNGWRGDTSIAKRVEHDIFYLENWSIWIDD